jgi:probable F420-dependent oxidoreductase
MSVKVGIQLNAVNNPLGSADRFWKVVDDCERLDFDSLWLSERASGPVLDSLSALAAMAGRTSRLKFGSSVLVVPAYNPVLLAKALASIDVLSKGRVLPAVGIGLDDPRELEALNIRKEERGRRLDEAIVLMKRLWSEERVTFHGAFYNVTEFTLWPRPVGPLPRAIRAGGSSDAAHRRAGRLCDGWLPSYTTPAEIERGIAAIQGYAAAANREVPDDHFGVLMPISFEPEPTSQMLSRRPNTDPREYAAFGSTEHMVAQGRRYVAAGASKLVLFPSRPEDLDQLARLREEVAAPLEAL